MMSTSGITNSRQWVLTIVISFYRQQHMLKLTIPIWITNPADAKRFGICDEYVLLFIRSFDHSFSSNKFWIFTFVVVVVYFSFRGWYLYVGWSRWTLSCINVAASSKTSFSAGSKSFHARTALRIMERASPGTWKKVPRNIKRFLYSRQ